MVEILIVDDIPTAINGLRLRLALEPDLVVAGEATDGREALKLAQALQPDMVVMDVAMPGMDGITATQRLRGLAPGTAVVMLSIHDDVETQIRAHQAGAAIFVEKQGPADTLVRAIRNAVPGSPGLSGGP